LDSTASLSNQRNLAFSPPLARRDLYALPIILIAATAAMLPILINDFPQGADIGHHYK